MTRLQKRLLTRIGGLGIFCFLFAVAVLIPKYMEKNNLSQAVAQLSGDNLQVKKVILTSHQFGERLHDIVSQLEYYRHRVPSRESLPEILEEIASRAQDNQLEVLSLQPMKDKPLTGSGNEPVEMGDKKIHELTIDMKARGKYVSLGHYLSQLEMAPYAILVKGVEIKNEKADIHAEGDPSLEIKLKLGVLLKESQGLLKP